MSMVFARIRAMASHAVHIAQNSRILDSRPTTDALAALLACDAPIDGFLAELLKTQCRLAGADGGVVIRLGKEKQLDFLAVYPPPKAKGTGARWIATAAKHARAALSCGQMVCKPESPGESPGNRPRRQVVIVPIQNGHSTRAVVAFAVPERAPGDLVLSCERLGITPFLITAYEMQWGARERHAALHRVREVLEALAAVNQGNRFMRAAMALCNETATRWKCNRVSLGLLKGRYVQVRAISHADSFNRKMKLLQDIEAAMEECLDQDLEVLYPASPDVTAICRATQNLAEANGSGSVLSLPLRWDNDVPGVVTLERSAMHPFTGAEIETIRLFIDLFTPRLMDLHEHDRWIGAHLAASMRRGLGQFIGPRHTWLKLCSVLIFSLAAFFTLARGEYRIESPFVLHSSVHQVVVSPFDSFIKSVSVVPGDKVESGKTRLGELETSEIRLKLAALKAEQLGYQKEIAASMRDRKTVESQIAQAQNDRVTAEIRLFEQNLAQAELVAPISGRIISQDLKQQIGAPVEKGKVLFEIASIESLRSELFVPEEWIADVREGQVGELAAIGRPDQRIGFVVERITPIAEVVNHRNVFRVRARLSAPPDWMRPGMEGTAKISAGKKRYAWIATRRLANWLRMKLWF